jgi:hypothetical protein
MNARHAASLALVGWYLMAAPPQSFRDNQYHEAPLGEWIHKGTFHSEFECKQKLSNGCHEVGGKGMLGFEGPLCWARCVASDDPRLKEK